MSGEIVDIQVDWYLRSAVIYFKTVEQATNVLKNMKIPNQNNFGDHKVAVDFCSDRLLQSFLSSQQANIRKTPRRPPPIDPNEYTNPSEPSTSSQYQQEESDRFSPNRGGEQRSPIKHRRKRERMMQQRESSSVERIQNEENEKSASPKREEASGSDDAASDSDQSDNDRDSGNEDGSSSGSSSSSSSNDDDEEEDDGNQGEAHFGRNSQGRDSPGLGRNRNGGEGNRRESADHTQKQSGSSRNIRQHNYDEEQRIRETSRKYDERRQITCFPGHVRGVPQQYSEEKPDIKPTRDALTSIIMDPEPTPKDDSGYGKMMSRLYWRDGRAIYAFAHRIDEVSDRNLRARVSFEKRTGRPFPRYSTDEEMRTRRMDSRDSLYEPNVTGELDLRIREWRRLSEFEELDEFRAMDLKELQRETPLFCTRVSNNRPSLDESRHTRHSFDLNNHPVELAQRSHSLCIGPMTPSTPYPTTMPLLVNTSSQQHGTSQPSTSGMTTPRSSHAPNLMSPVSRHNSVSSVGRPANIQTLRHQSVMFPPDLSVPPPSIPSQSDDREPSQSRRSSETMIPLKSPPFGSNIPNLCTMQIVPPSHIIAATGTHSVSSSAHSTPRHSISGTPVHQEPSIQRASQPQTPKSSKPEKVSIRHDSISKSGPSNAASALQARSQSMSSGEKKSAPPTPVVRDAGSDLIAQIMSNQPSMGFKKLPRIEKKPSALQNVHNPNMNTPSTPTTPAISHQGMMQKDKEKEKRRKEREMEREREARKEMKRKETKEERQKRKEMERAKREEDERRERKKEKQRMKEKEERRKEKERERRKAEKEKMKKKKHRKGDDSSDESDSTSNDELDLDVRKATKEMTQEEKDHQLALILSKGSIIENLKSRRRSDKRQDSLDKQKNQNSAPRRVLIESSDDDKDDGDDDEKDSSSGEADETEKRFMVPPSSAPGSSSKDSKSKVHKEREKGELSSSSGDEENKDEQDLLIHQKLKQQRDNRKRQKSPTNYSSDEQGDRKISGKRVRRDESEDAIRQNSWANKEELNQRKRKLDRRSSENEPRSKAKQRDFSDVPHEDVSDEEEVEQPSRIRRQSSSSTASNRESHGRKEKKNPMQVVTPVEIPPQSPKILSPKILSPKTSVASTKRASISDQESLSSPRSRNRTTSSTSTATTSSKHEASIIPDKPLSPPVTSKSSVSSMDEPVIRDDFNISSGVSSPMSSTGRPMVLTKAAMKAFSTSPPKKQSSSSGPHDSSSGSSSSSSSTEGSSSSSSGESSDDETLKPNDETLIESTVMTAVEEKENDSVHLQSEPISVDVQPDELSQNTDNITKSESDPSVEITESQSSEVVIVPQPLDETSQDSLSQPTVAQTEMKSASIGDDSDDIQIIETEETEKQKEDVESDVVKETEMESPPEKEESCEKETVEEEEEAVTTELIPSSPSDETSTPQEVPPSTHSLISDQETDQAVQSIFDEEEAEEFPQYPDFVIAGEDKETEKAITPPNDVNHKESYERKSSDSAHLTNGHSNHILSPNHSKLLNVKETITDVRIGGTTNEVPKESKDTPLGSKQSTVEEIELSDDDDERNLTIVESPEQTPTPELIPIDNTSNPIKANTTVEQPRTENHIQVDESAQAPIQPQKQLEVHVSQQNQQVVQPSPRPAVTPISEQSGGQPCSVVQQTGLMTPNGNGSSQVEDRALIESLLANNRIHELADYLKTIPDIASRYSPDLAQKITNAFLNPRANFQQNVQRQEQNALGEMMIQKDLEYSENIRRNEEIDRRMENNQSRESEQRPNSAIQKGSDKNQENNGLKNMEQLLRFIPQQARSLMSTLSGLNPRNKPGNNGLVNGGPHSPSQLLQRPSSTASTSTSSSRTPLQSSSSLNIRSSESLDKEEAHVQRWFYNHFPMVWSGRLGLKSTETMINLHLINGSETFLNDVLGRQITEENPRRDSVKILQRLRLDNGQLEHIYGILTNPEYACCLALSSSVDNVENLNRNEANLQASFIDYLTKKQIAGISSLEEIDTKFKSARVHVFAPGEIVTRYLSELASSLHDYLQNTNTRYLLIVFTNDKTEPNMSGPPSIASLAVPPLST